MHIRQMRCPHNSGYCRNPSGALLYLANMAVACVKCKKAPTTTRLLKCAGCFRPLCQKCGLRRYGNTFCCETCSEAFFFGTGEEDE
jgi:hypothetical protein